MPRNQQPCEAAESEVERQVVEIGNAVFVLMTERSLFERDDARCRACVKYPATGRGLSNLIRGAVDLGFEEVPLNALDG